MTIGSKKLPVVDDYTGLNEYLLLISPDGRLKSRLVSRKKEFTATYGNDDAERSLPHLTLANFILSDSNQDKIIKPLKDVASRSNKIGIELENFKWFKDHTIYVDVKYKTDMKQLVRKITNAIKRFIKADNNYPPHFILNPHLTLCKGLTSEQYKKSLLEYGALKFSDKFTAAEMILLKRSVIAAERYREVGRFRLEGPESNNRTIQLTLFNFFKIIYRGKSNYRKQICFSDKSTRLFRDYTRLQNLRVPAGTKSTRRTAQ